MVWLSFVAEGLQVLSGCAPGGIVPVQVTATEPGTAGAATVCDAGFEADESSTPPTSTANAAKAPNRAAWTGLAPLIRMLYLLAPSVSPRLRSALASHPPCARGRTERPG